MPLQTADLCDTYPDRVTVFPDHYRAYGGVRQLHAPIVTLRLVRNNAALIDLLKTPGEGRIVVVDVAAEYYAVVGETLMHLAQENGWGGILVHGYVRDTHITRTLPVGLWALGTCPRKSFDTYPGMLNIPLTIDAITVTPDQHLVIDEDGIVMVDPTIMQALDEIGVTT